MEASSPGFISLPKAISDLQERVKTLENLIANSTYELQDMRNEVRICYILYFQLSLLTTSIHRPKIKFESHLFESIAFDFSSL